MLIVKRLWCPSSKSSADRVDIFGQQLNNLRKLCCVVPGMSMHILAKSTGKALRNQTFEDKRVKINLNFQNGRSKRYFLKQR